MEKGLIIASFGTTHKDTRVKTISNIENALNHICGQKETYSLRAFTSRMVKKKLYERENLYVFNEWEAKDHLLDRGIREEDIFIQPLHLLPGHEFEKLKKLEGMKLGEPLFSSEEDIKNFVDTVPFKVDDDQVLLLFGHGTDHINDRIYQDLQKYYIKKGCKNIFILCVEGNESWDNTLDSLEKLNPTKIILQPLMIVAGDHAKNDMDSKEAGSLRYELEKRGYKVESRLMGLGEIPEVVELFKTKTNKLLDRGLDCKQSKKGYLVE